VAEKATSRKRSTRQAVAEAVAEAEKTAAERKEAEATPAERIAAKAAAAAVAAADAISSDDVVRSVAELKSTITRTLTQLADRMEEEVGKYNQIRRAIAAKDDELKEIYEIQRSASTLAALLDMHQRKQEELERSYQEEKEQLDREIETTRAEWEKERKLREQETKERDTAEQKRRQRELEEYKYNFAREQQLARDQAGDDLAKAEKELAERKTQLERQWAEREASLAAREQELAELRARVSGLPDQLKAAEDRARAETAERLEQQHESASELLRRELEGEKNVLSTKIAALERTAKDQAEQLTRLEEQLEKAREQVQEIAVRAIEGSASAKQIASLQQLLADQIRKGGPAER